MDLKREESVTSLELKSFYGKKRKRNQLDIERKLGNILKKHQEEKLPADYKGRISGPSIVWKVFYRQKDAFDFLYAEAQDAHVFSFESDSLGEMRGQRQFLVATYEVFWHYYRQLGASQKHHYEIIPEGAPCKLYFDLEYMKTYNPSCDGRTMMSVFKKFVSLCLKAVFSVVCDASHILELDATTGVKFSRHLIYLIPGIVFKDNSHVGHFVTYIFMKWMQRYRLACNDSNEIKGEKYVDSEQRQDRSVEMSQTSHLCFGNNTPNFASDGSVQFGEVSHTSSERILDNVFAQFSSQEVQSLIVRNKEGSEMLFCDLGVYTKNRNFRLLSSSKLGKLNPLVVSDDNCYSNLLCSKMNQMRQIVSTHNSTDAYRSFRPISNEKQLFLDSLVTNVHVSESLRILTFENESGGSEESGSFVKHHSRKPREVNCSAIDGDKNSPYPEIDAFIRKTITEKIPSAAVRRWTYFTEGELLIYETAGFRWCENIGRQHRSNNVMLLVDLKKGIFYQKCHDPDCRTPNFRSKEYPVPPDVLPAYYFQNDDFGDLVQNEVQSPSDFKIIHDFKKSAKRAPFLSTSTGQLHESSFTESDDDELDDMTLVKAAEDCESSF